MAEYIKKIAVIKQLKSGFSSDGGALSGMVKAESYAGFLKVEVSLINFAPLAEGRYLFGLTDGKNYHFFEGACCEAESPINIANGFAFAVCFCHKTAAPIASAYCGQAASALPCLVQAMQNAESVKKSPPIIYDDDAIAEDNYFENTPIESDNAVCKNQTRKEGQSIKKDETPIRPIAGKATVEELQGGFAHGDYYATVQAEVEKLLSSYPKLEELEGAIEGSKFVKIEYAKGQFYAFGVLYIGGKPAYLCYGVPSLNAQTPPKSFGGATYIPCKKGGYWLLYQDARTGVSVAVDIK